MWEIPFFGLLLLDIWFSHYFMSSLWAQTVQRTSPIDTSHTMVELAAVAVRKLLIIPICWAESTMERLIFITFLHQLKRFWNFGAHSHPAQAQAFMQSNLVMGAGDTNITDNAPVSWDLLTSECLSALPAPSIRLRGWRIGVYVTSLYLQELWNVPQIMSGCKPPLLFWAM